MDSLLITRLRSAGCVFAEEEASLLREAATDDADLERMVRARIGGEPLEYVVGFADFCGVRVALDRGVFIPRQRTEALVRIAASLAPPDPTVLDLCCGSGALGLVFAVLRPDADVHAADIDPLAVANARRNLPRVYEGDLFAGVPAGLRFDLVLANVPYVPTAELALMPVEAREHEPVATHDGGADGLAVLRRVLADAPAWLRPGGCVLFEVAEAQRPALDGLRLETCGDTTVAIATY